MINSHTQLLPPVVQASHCARRSGWHLVPDIGMSERQAIPSREAWNLQHRTSEYGRASETDLCRLNAREERARHPQGQGTYNVCYQSTEARTAVPSTNPLPILVLAAPAEDDSRLEPTLETPEERCHPQPYDTPCKHLPLSPQPALSRPVEPDQVHHIVYKASSTKRTNKPRKETRELYAWHTIDLHKPRRRSSLPSGVQR